MIPLCHFGRVYIRDIRQTDFSNHALADLNHKSRIKDLDYTTRENRPHGDILWFVWDVLSRSEVEIFPIVCFPENSHRQTQANRIIRHQGLQLFNFISQTEDMHSSANSRRN